MKTNTDYLAVEFMKWCYTPICKERNQLASQFRVQPQYPEYNMYIIIDATGYSIFPKGKYLTIEEVYNYWFNLKNKKTQ